MPYESITRTAPGWEERTTSLLTSAARAADGASVAVTLWPGFARLGVLLDVAAFGGGGGGGLRVWAQHSPDGARWHDLASFLAVGGVESQVAWIEAQRELTNAVQLVTNGLMLAGATQNGFVFPHLRVRWTVGGVSHTFGVDLVAIYHRRDLE